MRRWICLGVGRPRAGA
ncbi:unnamed protein product, partial [Rotaria socialis]